MPIPRAIGWLVEVSSTGAEELSVEWQIPDILDLPGGNEAFFCSPEFKMGEERWYLRFWPKWKTDPWNPASGWMKLFLGRIGEGPAKIFRLRVGIKGSTGVMRESSIERVVSKFGSQEWSEFCSRFALMEHQSRLIPDNILTIVCTIKIVPTSNEEQSKRLLEASYKMNVIESTKRGMEQALGDFGKLLESGEGSDVTIIVGGERFQVHRLVLSARSPVFSAMFSHDTMERSSNEITIEDCEPEIFGAYLEYLYTGSFRRLLSQQDAFSLYQIADRYLADNLKLQCLRQIQEGLSVRTFSDALELAAAHGESGLLEKAAVFASENIFLDSFYFKQNLL